MKKILTGLLSLSIIVALGYSGFRLEKWKVNQYIEIPEPESVIVKTDPVAISTFIENIGERDITLDNVMTLMDTLLVEYPHIVYAQMRLESGNFKSNIAKNNNNFFGMRHPRVRVTMSRGSLNGFASYDSWSYSVLDYAIWQRMYASGLTEEEYLELLSEKYAEDKSYVKKVRSIADSIKRK